MKEIVQYAPQKTSSVHHALESLIAVLAALAFVASEEFKTNATSSSIAKPGIMITRAYNPIGVVHGGVAATLLDSAMGCAVHSTLPAGARYTTLEIKVNYIRPMSAETGEVRCEANIIHVGARTATAEGKIVDQQGKLYAHATTTCIIFRSSGSKQELWRSPEYE
jgi:uncharacterized protein (TIGR00369 family)